MSEADDRAELAKLRHDVEALKAIIQAIIRCSALEASSPNGHVEMIREVAKENAGVFDIESDIGGAIENTIDGIPADFADALTDGDDFFEQLTPVRKIHALEVVLQGAFKGVTTKSERTKIAQDIQNEYLEQGVFSEDDQAVERLLTLFRNA